jgi:hypothetical protein
VLPLPLSSVKVNHKLVDEVKSAPSSMHEIGQRAAVSISFSLHASRRPGATVQTARMTKLSKERLQTLDGKAPKRRTGSHLQRPGQVDIHINFTTPVLPWADVADHVLAVSRLAGVTNS